MAKRKGHKCYHEVQQRTRFHLCIPHKDESGGMFLRGDCPVPFFVSTFGAPFFTKEPLFMKNVREKFCEKILPYVFLTSIFTKESLL